MENKETQALQLRDKATEQLAAIKTIETGVPYLNQVTAIEHWAKAEKKDAILQNLIAEQKLRVQRKLGSLIKDGQQRGEVASKNKGGANIAATNGINEGNTVKPKTLSEVGLTPHQSMDYQTIATMPEDEFEKEIALAKEESEKRVELTTSRVLRAAKRMQKVKEETGPSDPIFHEVSNLLLKTGDKLQYIVQGDYTPKTASDYASIDAIRHHMYRFVRMAGQLGINLNEVWDKTAARHGIKMELPEHLRQKKDNSHMDDAEIIND